MLLCVLASTHALAWALDAGEVTLPPADAAADAGAVAPPPASDAAPADGAAGTDRSADVATERPQERAPEGDDARATRGERAESSEGPRLRSSLSPRGLPGLIHVPIAASVPDGELDVSFSSMLEREALPRANRRADRQRSLSFAVGILPRLTIGGRGVLATDLRINRDTARDVSANAQLLLLTDRRWWPAIAAGIHDPGGGAPFFRSYFVVLSKELFGRVRATAGFGRGPDILRGAFGGLEVDVNRYVTVIGEYDGYAARPALRLFPFPESWQAYGVPRPTFDVILDEGRQLSWNVSLRAPLGGARPRPPREVAARAAPPTEMAPPAESAPHEADAESDEEGGSPRPRALAPLRCVRSRETGGPSFDALASSIQRELIDRGFENVSVRFTRGHAGLAVVVEYENRRFNRDELDALGVVLAVAAFRTPAEVGQVRAIVREVNLPVLDVRTGADAYAAFVHDGMSTADFAAQLRLSNEVDLADEQPAEARSGVGERSWLKLDAFARPRVETQVLTEVGVADFRFSVLPDGSTQLTPGTVLNVQGVVPVGRTDAFLKPLGHPGLERALAHQALRLPLGRWLPRAASMTQLSVGQFSAVDLGLAHETAATLFDGVAFVKATWARLGPSFVEGGRWVALGNARVRYPPWNLTVSITGGQFVDMDRGVTADVRRFFGDVEIGLFLRRTDQGSMAGFRVALPLTPSRELPPWRVRPRLPDVYAFEQSTTVFTNVNILRSDIGRALETGHELERVYWNRDRLYPAYIRQNVHSLAIAASTWAADASAPCATSVSTVER